MPDLRETYKVIGLMSGTSLDGLDICYCELKVNQGKWDYEILSAHTVPYDEQWTKKLAEAPRQNGEQLTLLDVEFGSYCGRQVRLVMKERDIKPDLIASHGHTIFHRPDLGYTLQIGSGAAIAEATGIQTVCDFRSQDVLLGGQGAPLVPIGDRLLFHDYDFCLNLGGFSNISYERGEHRIAFDITPVNIVLNALARREGQAYDEGGQLAAQGQIIQELYDKLNALAYYQQCPPKSLGREWVSENMDPLIREFSHHATCDLLRTLTEHIAFQISRVIPDQHGLTLLVTGGGALNTFLISRISGQTNVTVKVAENTLLNNKEALIFALLGVLRIREANNCLASVTGARQDHCGGSIYRP